jgi:hypothetical protein
MSRRSRPMLLRDVRLGASFRRRHCSDLCTPASYRRWNFRYAGVVTVVLAYGIGARRWALVSAVLLGWFPIAVAVNLVAYRVLPPTLTFSDDYLTHLKEMTTEPQPRLPDLEPPPSAWAIYMFVVLRIAVGLLSMVAVMFLSGQWDTSN